MLVRSSFVALAVLSPVPAMADHGSSDARLFVAGNLAAGGEAGIETLVGTLKTGLLGNSEVTVVTTDIVGDFVVSPSFKLHGRLPVVYYSNDNNDDTGMGVGNVTAGARFVAGGRGKSSRVGVGGSVSFPTAHDDGERGEAAFYGGVFRHLHDPGRYLPNVTTVRAEGDLVLGSGNLFFQGQFGVHVLMFQDGNTFPFGGDDQQNLLRLGVGGGAWVSPQLALLAEVTSFSNVLEDEDDDNYIHTLDTGVRYDSGGVSATFRVYVPFDEGERTEDAIGVGLDLVSKF